MEYPISLQNGRREKVFNFFFYLLFISIITIEIWVKDLGKFECVEKIYEKINFCRNPLKISKTKQKKSKNRKKIYNKNWIIKEILFIIILISIVIIMCTS